MPGDEASPPGDGTDAPPAAGLRSAAPTIPERRPERSEPVGDSQGLVAAGALVDQFKVLRLLGQGGMGEVYLARDTWLGRKVALKVLLPEALGSPAAVDLFLSEARITARLNHPHIVTLFAVGQHRGHPYVALEYLEGQNLRQRLRDRPLSPAEAVRTGLAIAQALQEAHRHRIFHRDLKPENVMIPRDGRIRVLDFGLARTVAQPAASDEEEPAAVAEPPDLGTGEAAVGKRTPRAGAGPCGTPSYMAPEQWLEEPVTGASDVWGLGLLLYEMVTGRRLYSGPVPAVATQICRPEAPALGSDLPEPLAQLVRRCLEKDPRRRPDADAVVEALGDLLVGDRAQPADRQPFRGLLPFDERHAGQFFGRSSEINAFVERLRAEPLLPVVGPSGAGKSSFVQAGVIPRLREQGRWAVLRLRPGRNPLRALAAQLVRGGEPRMPTAPSSTQASVDPSLPSLAGFPTVEPAALDEAERQLARELGDSPARLALKLGQIAEREESQVLLVVDPLEELYTLVDDEKVRATFLEALWAAADDPDGPVRAVFTLRDDFLGRLAATGTARVALSRVTVLATPGAAALEEILTRPLALAEWGYDDPALVGEMVAAVRGEPAALPLLQVTGQMLWRRRDQERRLLLRSAYDEMGGVAGALARHADGVLEGMTADRVSLARALLLRLVTAAGTRRIVPRAQLLEGLSGAEEVLERLVEGRLVLVRKARRGDDAELELVHESLIARWRRLARWLEEERGELAFREEVGQAAAFWARRGRRDEELWQGDALRDAGRRLERCRSPVPAAVVEFLAAGRRKEERRLRRRRTVALGGVALLVLVALVLAGLTIEARRQRRAADQRRAQVEREGARAALRRGDLLEARAKLRAALETEDSVLARALWWQLRRNPLRWKKNLWVIAWDVEFSPDGEVIAAASADGSIYLLDPITGDPRWGRDRGGIRPNILRGHQDQVRDLAFSPDATRLAAVTSGGEVGIWDLRGGTVRRIAELPGRLASVAWSHDGRLLATAGPDREVRLWDVETGSLVRQLVGGEARVLVIRFRPDGRVLATAGEDETVRLWDVEGGRELRVLRDHRHVVVDLAWSPDGRLLASACRDRLLRLWDPEQGTLVRSFAGHTDPLEGVAFSPDGQTLASAARDHSIRLWDVATGAERSRLHGHTNWAYQVSFSPDGKLLVSSGYDAFIRLWELETEVRAPPERGHGEPVWGVAFSPAGDRLASSGLDRTVRLWDVASGAELGVLRGHESDLTGIAWSPDGRLLASASMDRTVRLWDVATGHTVHVLTGHRYVVAAVSFSPDGRLVASSSWDGDVRLWDAATGAPLRQLRDHVEVIWSHAFGPDGRYLASGGSDRLVRLWEVASGRLDRVLGESAATVRAVSFSPDGRTVAAAGDDPLVRFWSVAGGRPRTAARHEGRILSLAFHPDGTRLGGSATGGTVRIWDLRGEITRVLRGHRGDANAFRFHPDGSLAATAGNDGTVRVWEADSGRPLWRAPVLLGSPPEVLTHRGWRRLDDPVADPARAVGSAWRRAVERQGRLGAPSEDGRTLCLLTVSDTLRQWDLAHDRLVHEEEPGPTPEEVLATPAGCVVRTRNGEVALFDPSGDRRLLHQDANALALAGGEILIAADREVLIYPSSGTEPIRRGVDVGVTALTRIGPSLVVGFRGGGIELLALDPGQAERRLDFEDLPASPVVRLLPGPKRTVIAGYANGRLGIWSLGNGDRLLQVKLHGPVVHLLLAGHRLYAATELGDVEVLDLDVYYRDHCALLREVWGEVPVIWENGLAVPRAPAASHACAGDQAPASWAEAGT